MKQSKKPKLRRVWSINPKTRVKEGKRKYRRPTERKAARKELSKIDWFGEAKT